MASLRLAMKLSLAESGAKPLPKAPAPKLTGKPMSKAKRDAQAAAAAAAVAAAEAREAEVAAARAAAVHRGLRLPVRLQRRQATEGAAAIDEGESTLSSVGAEAVECDLAAAALERAHLDLLAVAVAKRGLSRAAMTEWSVDVRFCPTGARVAFYDGETGSSFGTVEAAAEALVVHYDDSNGIEIPEFEDEDGAAVAGASARSASAAPRAAVPPTVRTGPAASGPTAPKRKATSEKKDATQAAARKRPRASGDLWVRRSIRASGQGMLQSRNLNELLDKIRDNHGDAVVLKLKDYLGPEVNTWIIDSILDALMVNTNCQALYIQNFNDGMLDVQLQKLSKVLQLGRIWCLNIGENYRITPGAWNQFADSLLATNVTHMYASEHVISVEQKTRMRDIIRANRAKHSRHNSIDNIAVIKRCTNCWWNPIQSRSLMGLRAAERLQQSPVPPKSHSPPPPPPPPPSVADAPQMHGGEPAYIERKAQPPLPGAAEVHARIPREDQCVQEPAAADEASAPVAMVAEEATELTESKSTATSLERPMAGDGPTSAVEGEIQKREPCATELSLKQGADRTAAAVAAASTIPMEVEYATGAGAQPQEENAISEEVPELVATAPRAPSVLEKTAGIDDECTIAEKGRAVPPNHERSPLAEVSGFR